MKNDIRSSGIEIVGNIPSGTHFCQFYQTKEDLIEVVIPYFKAGLENNEFCLWITSDIIQTEDAKKVLKEFISDIDTYFEKRQIEIIPFTDFYSKEGIIDSQKVLNYIINRTNQALISGYDGLRLTENVCSFNKEKLDNFVVYEERLNSIIDEYPVISLCTYSLEKCSSIDIIEITANHDFVLAKKNDKWEQIKNPRQKDITEIKKVQKAAEKERARLQTIIENIPVAVGETDASGGVLLDNGMLESIWRGKHKLDSVSDYQEFKAWWPETGERVKPEEWPAARALKGEISTATFDIEKFDGTKGTIIVSARPIIGEKGEVTSTIWINQDITELKQAEEALHEAYEELQIQSEELQASYEEVQIQSEELQAQTEELQDACQAISESEKKHQLLFDHSMDAIILADPRRDGKVLAANPAACRMLGWSEDELIDKGRNVMLDPEDSELSTLLDERTRSGSARTQLTYRRKDGTKFVGEISTALFRDINGEPRAVAIIRDITERKKAEESLRKSEERYRILFTNMTEAFLLAEVIYNENNKPCDYRVLEVNPAYEFNMGIKKEQIVGKSVLEIFPNASPIAIEKSCEVALSGKSTHFENFSSAVGKYFEVYAFCPEEGKFAAVFRDITERKKAEETLRESQSRLETVFSAIPDPIIEYDINGKPIRANETAIKAYGLRPPDLTRDKAVDKLKIVHMDDSPVKVEELPTSRALKGEVIAGELYRFTDAEGKELIITTYAAPLLKDDKVNGAVALWHDITELKRAEDALRRSEKHYRTLFTNMTEGFILVEVICNKDGKPCDYRYLEINPAFELQTDIKKEKLLGKSVLELFPNPDPAEIEKLNEVALLGKPTYFEVFRQALNKHFGIYLFSPEKELIGGIFRDITERKKAETKLKETLDNLEEKVKDRTAELEKAYNSLKESERGLAEAQAMAHIGNWSWDVKTNELHWSDEVYRIFGLKPQEFSITFDKYFNYIHSDDRDYIINAIREAFKGKPYRVDNRIITANGEERIIHTNAEIIFNKENIPVYAKGIVQDITEHRKAEKALQENEARFRNLFETIPSGVIIYDVIDNGRDFIFKDINPAGETIDRVRKEDIIGKSLYEFFPNVSEMGLDVAFRRVWLTGKPEFFPVTFYKDERIGMWVTNHIYRLPSGELVAVFDDITQRKQTEEALEKINEIRIKEIHHRIKNNLQVISSLLDLQAETFSQLEVCKVPEVLEAFKESQSRVISMALIHEELYEGKESGNLDFAAYLRKLTDYLLNSYNLKTAQISLELDFEKVYLDMDTAIPLGIIVNELVLNSLKHAFPNGKKREISITLHRTENFATNKENCGLGNKFDNNCKENNFCYALTVADNGKGIPEEIDFQNAETLGLQLVNILVDQIDGYIELKRDHGTEFTILFSDTAR